MNGDPDEINRDAKLYTSLHSEGEDWGYWTYVAIAGEVGTIK